MGTNRYQWVSLNVDCETMVQIIENSEPNRIADFFKDKTILITGGSGFLGKVLIEKLLRSCTDLRRIYVLIRAKNGKNIHDRLQDIFSGPLFEMLKKQHGKIVLEKVEPISGDISAPDLGLSPDDRLKLVQETEIIYHSAATVQFDEPFKKTVLLNVRGTRLMLTLAKECKKLIVFCHVSTAYCQETQEVLNEKTYPPPCDPHRIIDMCEWMNEDTLDTIAQKMRGASANNYTFTKALGEGLVTEQMDTLPVIIQRPAAVVPIWKEPVPGWTDNINGPTGLLIGAGKGVIRTMYGRSDYFADYVAVDIIANGLIVTAYDYVTYRVRRVYNMTSSDEHLVTFQDIIEMGQNIINTKVAFDWVLWYPGGGITNSRLWHNIRFYFFQLLPAIFVDIILMLIGFRPFLTRIQRKIKRGYQIFEYYSNRRWDFRKESADVIRKWMNETERKVFKVDDEGLNYYDYFVSCTLGARRYIRNEKDENIPNALRRIKMMWFVDKMCKILIVVGFFYYLIKKISGIFGI
ncbi:putative fatty acyl-CoA reductase CG5065 [Tribolium madens]|uniref:putative fatty acyl-CoA reductase CG5065 n=1 Tax=Tribolium madens TaxID=41895 RepID=UPI001CF75B67|nr:putative fatty acyl-CoA reductase CG5065 [Tribolium madens]